MNPFVQSPNDQVVNERLKRLALIAQGTPRHSHRRRQALDQLIRAIQAAGQLVRPSLEYQYQRWYEEIYAEALQQLFLHVVTHIEDYQPRYEVMQWVNFLLKRRFFPAARDAVVPHYVHPKRKRVVATLLSLEAIEAETSFQSSTNEPLSPSQELRHYCQTDPDGELAVLSLPSRPDITLQKLLLYRLDGYTWREISVELGIPEKTLYGFYRQKLPRVIPYIKAYLSQ